MPIGERFVKIREVLLNKEGLDRVTKELERQAGIYQKLGFHGFLGIPDGALKDQIMSLASPQPARFRKKVFVSTLAPDLEKILGPAVPTPGEFRERFDIPLVVFGNIPMEEQCKRAGIPLCYDAHKAYEADPEKFRTPPRPYLTWMQDGVRYKHKSEEWVHGHLDGDERCATQFDGVALAIVYRNRVLEAGHVILFPGTVVGFLPEWKTSDQSFIDNPFSIASAPYVPSLFPFGGVLKFALSHGFGSPLCGSATCGKSK